MLVAIPLAEPVGGSRDDPANTSPENPFEPIQITLVSSVAPVPGFLVLGEELDWATGAGFLVIFAGFCLVKRRAIRSELASWRA